MLQSRQADASAPAAKALARLGDRSIIPTLLNMIGELDETKGAAAIFALAELGGEDVIEQMKLRVRNAEGREWYRLALVLYKLGDPMGRELLVKAFNDMPTLKVEAARYLVKEGDWDATQFLRSRLERREDANFVNLSTRARNAATLYASGDFSSKVVLQQLTTAEIPEIRSLLSFLIVEIGDRSLFTVLQPLLVDESDPKVSLTATTAAMALANPDFRRRLMAAME
jgi:HEAT repeat protein